MRFAFFSILRFILNGYFINNMAINTCFLLMYTPVDYALC